MGRLFWADAPAGTYYLNSVGLRLISSDGIRLSPNFFRTSSPYIKEKTS